MQCSLRVLGVGVELSGPAGVIEPIAVAYRRFRVDDAGAGAGRLELHDNSGEMTIDGRRVALVPELDRTLQVYQLFLNHLMDRIESHAVLHAGALVTPDGAALLLAAPSGHGKSSLTLELAHRGLRFLSDDFAPLDLAARTIAPYPRAVGVVPGGTAPLPEPFRARVGAPGGTRLFEKKLLDVGDVLGEGRLASDPVPLRQIALLSAGLPRGASPGTWIEAVSRAEEAEGLDREFAATDGLEIVARHLQPPLCRWKLRLRHELRPTRALSRILDSDRILFTDKYWDARPDFSATPSATPIPRREAAEALGSELLNRRGGGRLLARYDGRVAALFIDLAGALRDASCWRVTVGEYRKTANLIQELVSNGGPRA